MTKAKLPTGWPRGLPFPIGWKAPLLSEVAHRESGHTPDKEVPEYWNGGIKWLSLTDCDLLNRVYVGDPSKRISQAGLDNSSARLLPAGVVVLTRDAGVGQSAITTCPMAVSQHFLAWQCSDRLDSHFLYYWLQYLRPELERIAVGSTIKTIGLWYFDKLRIPQPPVDVQRRVATALLECDKLGFSVKALIASKKELKRGLMQQLLTGQKRFPRFGDRPWVKHRIGDLFEEVSRPVTWNDSEEYRLVSIRRRSGGMFLREIKKGADIKTKQLYVIRTGDIVISRMQVVHGAVSIVPREFDGCHVSGTYLVLQARTGACIDPRFFDYLTQTPHMYHAALTSSYGVHIEKMTFNPEWYLETPIHVPPTLDEQGRIVDVLGLIDREVVLLGAQQAKIEDYKRGLLSKLLSGEIPVPA